MQKLNHVIATFTMVADHAEDRIRMDTQSSQGDLCSIHWTRRLADRCVPALALKAERHISGALPKDLALSFQQDALRAERDANPLAPVPRQSEGRPYLSHCIHLSEQERGVVLTHTDGSTFEAHMPLDFSAISALLDVLLITYRALEWSEAAFPPWVRERGRTIAQSALN